jgi:hypothetical protein
VAKALANVATTLSKTATKPLTASTSTTWMVAT